MSTEETSSLPSIPTMAPPTAVRPSGTSPANGSTLAPSLVPTTEQLESGIRGFSGVGDFFQGLLRNFTGNNPAGTGTGATVGTIALSGLGMYLGGLPGLLIGAGAGFLGGGMLNHLAVGLMSTLGMRTPAPPSFTPTLPERQPVQELARVQPLSVEQADAPPVQTTTIVPRTENYRQLENLTLSLNQYRLEHGGDMGRLGDNIKQRLEKIRATTAGTRRTAETNELFSDQRHVYQFMENVQGWNELVSQWNQGDRLRLIQADNAAAQELAIQELVIPEPPTQPNAEWFSQLRMPLLRREVLRIYRPDGVPAGQREAHFYQTHDTGIKQLQFLYRHLDSELSHIHSTLPDLEKRAISGDGSFKANFWNCFGDIENATLDLKGRFALVSNMPTNNATDLARKVSRVMQLTPDEMPSGMRSRQDIYTYAAQWANDGLAKLPTEGGDGTTVQAQREYFQSIIEMDRLERSRRLADHHFASYANAAEAGYNSLVRDGQFQQYAQQVESLRQQVDQRNARVQELRQRGIRFTERGQRVDANHRWVTVQTGNDSPPVLVTLIAEAQGGQWVVTHAYNGPHNDAADRDAANALTVPMAMTDVFTPAGMLATTNLGNVLHQSLVQLHAAKPSVSLGTFQPGPAPSLTVWTATTNPAPSNPAVVPPSGLPPRPGAPATVGVN